MKMKKIKLSLSFYVSVLLVIIGLVVLRTAIRLPFSTAFAGVGGPGTFPTAYLAIIIVFSAILAVQELIKSIAAAGTSEAEPTTAEDENIIMRILLLCVAVALYIIYLSSVGFMVATPLLVLALLWLFGYRNILISPVLAIGFTVILRLVFQTFLRVLLP